MPFCRAASLSHAFSWVCFFGFLFSAGLGAEFLSAAEPAAPIIPVFSRFYDNAKADAATGGRLLLGELNCTACHKPGDGFKKQLLTKQAPILDGIGSRVSVSYLQKFIANPHSVKPGTTMPNLFAALPENEKRKQVDALVQFLASTGSFRHTFPNVAAAKSGGKLFHQVGCAACHGSQKPGAKNPAHAVPLGNPAEKYSVASLTAFLRDPLKTRPAGRMPSLNLSQKEANSIASFFLKNIKVPANLTFKYYEGNWPTVPDFSKIKAKASGGAAGFDLRTARRKSNFGMRFEGFLQIRRAGDYTFFLGSDDGSKLFIDGKLVAVNDGIHPYTVKTGKTKLKPGPHRVIVDYTQGGGEWVLRVDYQGPGVRRQPMGSALTSTEQPPKAESGFKADPQLVANGRELFATVGCASCHQLRDKGKLIEPKMAARASQLGAPNWRQGKGCIGKTPVQGLPHFRVTERQRTAIVTAALGKPPVRPPGAVVSQTMTAMNCNACHTRGKIGGPVEQLDAFFTTSIKEMGEEGRVPPPLDGVGDKLTDNWLKHVLANGVNDRPYMLTRMPKFGAANVGHLTEAFAKADRKTLVKPAVTNTKLLYLKSAGRKLVGDRAFSCIKCHTFGKYKATGIQSLDLTLLTMRIREDWFYRYMMKPIRYRPGTRMPTPFPVGMSTLPGVLDGKPATQLLAMWTYLKDGRNARTPTGLIRGGIPLRPISEPIIYRNFIQGLSPRGLAVGYPGGLNLAFDAGKMVLGLLWHGAFIDAAKHWKGRGSGAQGPLGDHVISLPREAPFAVLESIDTAWPKKSAQELGYRFLGYRLDKKRQPVFRYRYERIEIEDHPEPVKGELDPSLKRTFVLQFKSPRVAPRGTPPALLYLAAASSKPIKPLKDGWYQVDDVLRVRVSHDKSAKPIIRKNGNRFELLVPVTFEGKEAKFVHEYVW